jgi:hypothetical protein
MEEKQEILNELLGLSLIYSEIKNPKRKPEIKLNKVEPKT